MFKIYIKTLTLFLVILVGLTAAWLVFHAFKFFKNFPLIFTIKKHTKKKKQSKTESVLGFKISD